MKVRELVRQSRQASLSPVEKKVLAYLESRPDEVFGYRDADLAKAVNLKPSTIRFCLWSLARKNLVRTIRIGRRVYFGSQRAIDQAELLLGARRRTSKAEDPLAAARALRERIRRRVGFVDGLKLLEESRTRHG